MSKNKKLDSYVLGLICLCCGEKYDFSTFEDEELREFRVCGECGSDSFVTMSDHPLYGVRSLDHYDKLINLVPEHLKATVIERFTLNYPHYLELSKKLT
jgi:hypothetical protein